MTMKETTLRLTVTDKSTDLSRPQLNMEKLRQTVERIFEDVRQNGDEAVRKYTALYDGVDISQPLVTERELAEARQAVPEELKQAIETAYRNIDTFHRAQFTARMPEVETAPGVYCWQEARPIEKVGLYVPGGSAPLFSTVLMLGIPARIAGSKEVVLFTPPGKDGRIHPAVLYAAERTGISRIYKAGGIQAIAAMTYGTESVPKVYKIFGPGNQYVTAAKQYALQLGTAIDMPAGPSELMVVADETARPDFVAADLLSQAEHGPDSQVICLSDSQEFLRQVAAELERQLKDLPRKDIAVQSLENAKLIYVDNPADTIRIVNEYAPEHLILATGRNDFYIENVLNAGSVFIGNYTPESAGDYASGTNHTLPTNGYAKAYGGVSTESFVKRISFQRITPEGLQNIGKAIEILATAEGLQAHQNAVSIRLKAISNE